MSVLSQLVANVYNFRQTMADMLGGGWVGSTTSSGVTKKLSKACGYPDTITDLSYWNMFSREGIAERVVSLYPDECWAVPPEVYEKEDKEETAFELAWKQHVEDRDPWHYLHRLDVLSGVVHYGVLFIGLNDGLELKEPVAGVVDGEEPSAGYSRTSGPPKVMFLRAFDELTAKIASYETNPRSPRYGHPTSYRIAFSDQRSEGAASGVGAPPNLETEVHWTRVIHVADNKTTSELFGTPRLKPVYNRILDLMKVLGGCGEMFWRGAFPGMLFESLPDAGGVEIDHDSLNEEVTKYADDLQRFMAVDQMKGTMLAPAVADPTKHLEAQYGAIALQLRCPLRVLLGSEQGELASSQDKGSWNGRLKRRQSTHITTQIVRPYIRRLVAIGALPPPVSVIVKWQDLHTPSDKEKAEVSLAKTQALSAFVAGDCQVAVPTTGYLEHFLGIDPELAESWKEETVDIIAEMEAKDMALAAAKAPPPPPGKAPGFGKAAPPPPPKKPA